MIRNTLAEIAKNYRTDVPNLYKPGIISKIVSFFTNNSEKSSWCWDMADSLNGEYTFVSFSYNELGKTKSFVILVEDT